MIVLALCRPDVDRELATKVAIWLRRHVKRDERGQTAVEFYVWGDDAS